MARKVEESEVKASYLPIAVRAWPVREKAKSPGQKQTGKPTWPEDVFLLDTETTTDETQRLLFGSYRHCAWGEDGKLACLQEGLIYADDLPETDPAGLECLREFARTQPPAGSARRLRLLSRTKFVGTVFRRLALTAEGLVVGFNVPFDLSRLAVAWGEGKGRSRGAFSLVLRDYVHPKTGMRTPSAHVPRVTIRHLDSKRAFFGLSGSKNGEDDGREQPFDGRFLDLRTLAFALTSVGHSLRSACKAFGVAEGKGEPETHGIITPAYIEYNRQDVRASQGLLERLRAEFDRHPIELPPDKAFSPASIAKAYDRSMGLRPPAEKAGKMPPEAIGHAMSAFFGGRAECRIRKVPVPVVHTDFTSMYPTAQSRMGLWSLLTAAELKTYEETEGVRQLLAEVSLDRCFRPELWPQLVGFAEVLPEGDVLPARAKHQGDEWTVGVNSLTAETPLWFALPDLVASTLYTGKPPKFLGAFRLIGKGMQEGLRAVRLRGEVPVDPREEDLFRAMIEKRQLLKADESLPREERERTEQFLKILANSGSYGIFVEMNRKDTPKESPADLTIYGRAGGFETRSGAPEDPGPFSFPPLGSLVTAGARLKLAMLERCVTDAGGSYAFADTDSMAIVASREGGLVSCPGGRERLPGKHRAIRALSWREVEAIRERFEVLNPYDRDSVPGSILRLEDVNFDAEGHQRELTAYVISAKRYALYVRGEDGLPKVPRGKGGYSEHGLGQLLNPIDPASEDREWIRKAWEGILAEEQGGAPFRPAWGSRPAVVKAAASKPRVLRSFEERNRGKPYPEQVKPFNFLLSAAVAQYDRPADAAETGFRLVAPFELDPGKWTRREWIDLHTDQLYRIHTGDRSRPSRVRVKTCADYIEEFRNHPEAKSAAPDGRPAGKQARGLLRRRKIHALTVFHIGKETNLLEQQEEGILIGDPQQVYFGGGEWEEIRKQLCRLSLRKVSKVTGVSVRMLRNLRNGARGALPGKVKPIMDAIEALKTT